MSGHGEGKTGILLKKNRKEKMGKMVVQGWGSKLTKFCNGRLEEFIFSFLYFLNH